MQALVSYLNVTSRRKLRRDPGARAVSHRRPLLHAPNTLQPSSNSLQPTSNAQNAESQPAYLFRSSHRHFVAYGPQSQHFRYRGTLTSHFTRINPSSPFIRFTDFFPKKRDFPGVWTLQFLRVGNISSESETGSTMAHKAPAGILPLLICCQRQWLYAENDLLESHACEFISTVPDNFLSENSTMQLRKCDLTYSPLFKYISSRIKTGNKFMHP